MPFEAIAETRRVLERTQRALLTFQLVKSEPLTNLRPSLGNFFLSSASLPKGEEEARGSA
ncbi:MAG: hypothetical protein QXZ09_09725 [Candidatus Methanomethylicaceae archaeon]